LETECSKEKLGLKSDVFRAELRKLLEELHSLFSSPNISTNMK
jgi:hypothetical protein